MNWVTADGTARAGADYAAGAGGVLFALGETSGSIRVAVPDDLLPEPAETFTVSLSGPTSAGIEMASAIGAITDDDEAMTKGWLPRFWTDGGESGRRGNHRAPGGGRWWNHLSRFVAALTDSVAPPHRKSRYGGPPDSAIPGASRQR